MMFSKYLLGFLLTIVLSHFAVADPIDLTGQWSFQMDRDDVGLTQQWFNKKLSENIKLPGSIQEQNYGDDVGPDTPWTGGVRQKEWNQSRYAPYRNADNFKMPFWLQPIKYYKGATWFQRSIAVPAEWSDKRIVLTLERCHWETTVWINGKKVGSQNSLSTTHQYDLTDALISGTQVKKQVTLTVRVDNRVKINVGNDAHSVTDHTQSNWNGIVGKIQLHATNRVWIDDVQIYPDLITQFAKVKITLGNLTKNSGQGEFIVSAKSYNTRKQHVVSKKKVQIKFTNEKHTVVEFDYPMGSDVQLWDEFNPALYQLTISMKADTKKLKHQESKSITFGMRQLTSKGTQFILNNQPIMLRGTLECNIFPLTGYPPTDVNSWKRVIRICQKHGLNHMRFHSHCPPKAAFIAADELGFYFQVEGPFWTAVGNGGTTDKYIYAECDRILKAYGNHPSFMLMAYGNEPGGKNQRRFLGDLVNYWKKKDPRHLYTSASGWPIISENQFHDTPGPRIHAWGAGLRSRINAKPPETATDYRKFIQRYDVPVVSHEIGQWCVYPNFDEIKKYTGVLKAKNFEVFRDFLKQHHMADQAHDFLMASGKLQTLCYKEEIESALRTPGFGGFQLLDLHDFPGQGTALVGVLDPFWESKPYVSPDEFRRFCHSTVVLARMTKRIFTSDETLTAQIDVSHFGKRDLKNAKLRWQLVNDSKTVVKKGVLQVNKIVRGKLSQAGSISVPLNSIKQATKLTLVVTLENNEAGMVGKFGKIENDWDIWVYPPKVDTTPSTDITVAHDLDQQTIAKLKAGGKVLLLIKPGQVKSDVAIGFSSIFWNTAWTGNQPPHTLGILCNPDHPALAQFPTEYHTNWQWWELIHGSSAMVLDDLPPKLRPTVQVIDTWFNNRRLGLAFEAKVFNGKLLVCSMDLESELAQRYAARQMRYSLLNYMTGKQFDPQINVAIKQLSSLMVESTNLQKIGAAIKVDSQQTGYPATNLIDGNPHTIWHSRWEPTRDPMPHHIVIDMGKPIAMVGLSCLPRQDMSNGRIAKYEIRLSNDDHQWGKAVASGTWPNNDKLKTIRFNSPQTMRYVKLSAYKEVNGQPYAAAAEIDILLK